MNLKNWFSQPINIVGGGVIVDFRRILGEKNKVAISIYSNDKCLKRIESFLGGFAGEKVEVIIKNHNHKILHATLLVDSSAIEAEGEGTLFEDKSNDSIPGNKFSYTLETLKPKE